jgi:flagellar biosynthesis/type III secretory pathway M-ring protein FliF/YscJ
MFIKIFVVFLFVALCLMVVLIIRQRSEQAAKQNNQAPAPKRKPSWSELLNNLTLEQLEKKLYNFEQKRKVMTAGFVNLDPFDQSNLMKRAARLNEKIERVREAIEERRRWNSDRY